MPYIIKQNRPQYFPIIENTVGLICGEKDDLAKAEYLGCFLEQLCLNFKYIDPVFTMLELDKRMALKDNATIVYKHIILNRDLLDQAGEINYVMSAITWGVLGDSLYGPVARYGLRVYVKGILTNLYDRVAASLNSGDQIGRQTLILGGVISDVIDEMYRRKTAVYENHKIIENGDIWPLRDINWVEEVPLDIRQECDEKVDQLYE